jgi:hypothetical protein
MCDEDERLTVCASASDDLDAGKNEIVFDHALAELVARLCFEGFDFGLTERRGKSTI